MAPHGHDHDHSHGHHHGHSHGEAPKNFSLAFAIGIILNIAFVVIEGIFGYLSNSLALIADAGHNLSDVLGLAISWGAILISRKKATSTFTYGFRNSSILAAWINALVLLLAIGALAWEALQRFWNPSPVVGQTVIVVAGIGIAINLGTALLFMKNRHHDINIKSAFLHMMTDAAISLAVVLAGFGMIYTGWLWLDPVITLGVCVIIIFSTWSLLKDSTRLVLSGVPTSIQLEKIKDYLMSLGNVTEVHDLHVWALSTTENALTAHLVIPTGYPGEKVLCDIETELKNRFRISHVTIQIETTSQEHGCN